MPPPRRRRYKKRRRLADAAPVEADALISLPADVLNVILTRLDLRDAVRTSALSRAWRYRWEALPSLDLHFPRLKDDEGAPKGLRAVDGILLRCPGRVRRFCVFLDEPYAARIHDWLLVLSRRGVETLHISSIDGFLALPSSLFTCGQLTSLSLFRCAIPPLPPGFQGLRELRNFTLINVRLQKKGGYQLEKIIATSPSLEELTLWDVTIRGRFKEWVIQATNLRFLKICSANDYGWNLGDLPRLDYAVIDIWHYLGGDCDFSKFLSRLANVTELCIYTCHSPVRPDALALSVLIMNIWAQFSTHVLLNFLTDKRQH
ncbi:F-box/FBD/LRR-repeat protein At1g13570-like [Triticum aestivum]|nr:F-box/FBD/LRR-repeat protein At1g13570-like [Triticum aestivum]